ncbi:MAG TPA: type II CAAX endopeptidase family protein [Pyrinomonadaceae bacterium]
MRKIFINDVGRLRSGWRLMLFVLAGFAAWFVIGAILWVAYSIVLAVAPQLRPSFFAADFVFRLALLASALGAGYLCARLLEGLPWRSLGLTLHLGWLRDLVIGSAVGFVSLAIAVGIATAGGGLRFSLTAAAATSLLRSMIGSGGLLVVAALAEEAMFRGYGLQTLARARLVWLGLLLTSVPFGVAHLDNPNVVPFVTFANTTLAGIWLGAAYLKTRSLWLPLGVHWAWNWALGWFFGLPISGINIVSNPLLRGTDIGPAWLTGGTYGIEGGIGCTVALILSTLFLWRTSWLSATPELAQLTSEENPATPEPVLTVRPVDDHA